MKILAHLSDIHFGAEEPVLVAAVREYLHALQPQLTVISGDLTQRARKEQFRAARAFLNSLPGPKLVVPGNHDIPLWNVWARFLTPLTSYAQEITHDFAPAYLDDEMAVVGINTARSLTRKNGRINRQQAAETGRRLRRFGEGPMKVVVTHHPFDLPESRQSRDLVGRARMGLKMLAQAGADILLSGHLHEAYTGGTAQRYPIDGYSALVVQAGTATSHRTRLSPNSFNVLRIAPPRVEVEIVNWDAAAGRFATASRQLYERQAETGMSRVTLDGRQGA